MTFWTCNTCGNVERLTIHPDCCSLCGGTMETQDGRSTAGTAYECLDAIRSDARYGDEGAIVWLWQEGESLSASMQDTVDGLSLLNRIALMEAVFSAEAA